MGDEPKTRDWEALDLEPGAGKEQVERAYRHRRELYSPGTLASYSLYDEDERQWLLEQLEEAYLRILQSADTAAATARAAESAVEPPTDALPDMDEQPGNHLRHHRLASGVTIPRLAEETKIRASLLEIVENEEFADLPAEVYVRGFVVQCAKALGVEDPDRLAAAYLTKMKASIGNGE